MRLNHFYDVLGVKNLKKNAYKRMNRQNFLKQSTDPTSNVIKLSHLYANIPFVWQKKPKSRLQTEKDRRLQTPPLLPHKAGRSKKAKIGGFLIL